MSDNGNFTREDEVRLRKQIEKRYQERMGIWIHTAIFVTINIMLWMIYLTSGGNKSFPWPMIVTLGWIAGYIGHLLTYYYRYGGGAQKREDAIQDEIQRYRERYAYEKPKNDSRGHLEVTEDGEIDDMYDDASPEREQR